MHKLSRAGKQIILSSMRLYLRHMPINKGKHIVWSCAKHLLRDWQSVLGTFVTTTRDGHRLTVRSTEFGERRVHFLGYWNRETEWLMRQILRPGDVFVDCGANVGYFTLLGAKLVESEGRVLAFEASPENVERCRQHVMWNGYANVTSYGYAVSIAAGMVTLYQPDNGCDLATMRSSIGAGTKLVCREHKVTAVRLDEFIPRDVASRIRLIKIDVEGADYLALAGLEGILKSVPGPDVICEVDDAFLKEMGSSEAELMSYMRNLGYTPYRFDNQQLVAVIDCKGGHYDALFTRRSLAM